MSFFMFSCGTDAQILSPRHTHTGFFDSETERWQLATTTHTDTHWHRFTFKTILFSCYLTVIYWRRDPLEAAGWTVDCTFAGLVCVMSIQTANAVKSSPVQGVLQFVFYGINQRFLWSKYCVFALSCSCLNLKEQLVNFLLTDRQLLEYVGH